MEGYLYQWTGVMKGWKLKYFFIDKHILYFSKEKQDVKKKCVHLKIARVIDDEKKNSFCIHTGSHKVYVKSSTEEDKRLWMESLNNEISFLNFQPKGTQVTQKAPLKKEEVFSVMHEENTKNIKEFEKRLDEFDFEKDNQDWNKLMINKVNEMMKLIQNFQRSYHAFSFVLEGFNLIIMKGKFKEDIKKTYVELLQVKQEFKENVDLGFKNIVILKDISFHVLEIYGQGFSRMSLIKNPSQIQETNNSLPSETENKKSEIEEIKKINIYEEDNYNGTSYSDFYSNIYNIKRSSLSSKIKLSKNMLGDLIKSLTKEKIQLPIVYNEPISMLQKLCEKFQFSQYLSIANIQENRYTQLALISCFLLGEISLSINRVLKPFNPIRGETFEFYDNELQYRFIAEQVCHHPPISSFYCESQDFEVFGDTRCKNGFKLLKGAMEVLFLSKDHVVLKRNNHHFSFSKPAMYLKGLITSSLYSDFKEVSKIVNHNTGDFLNLEFFESGKKSHPDGYVEGKIFDRENKIKCFLKGSWKDSYYLIVLKSKNEQEFQSIKFDKLKEKSIKIDLNDPLSVILISQAIDNQEDSIFEIWKLINDECFKKFDPDNYLLSNYAYRLNHIDENLYKILPHSDSRLRPDQRMAENGNFVEGEEMKTKLENLQREAHQYYIDNKLDYEPNYFQEILETHTNESLFVYKGDYWKDRKSHNFNHIKNIFS